MSELSRARLERYDSELAAVESAAERAASDELASWWSSHLDASVQEVRDHATALVRSLLDRYGDAAGELACRLYDERAESAGADVPPAELPDVGEDTLRAIDRRVRYLAGRIADEGPREDI